MKIGVLHPGNMGVSVAASIRQGGHTVYWASEGRSPQTAERAKENGLTDAGTLQGVCDASDIVFSICPPEAASQLASDVKASGFGGTFVDANAISPVRMTSIAADLEPAGITVVDGGIIGHPAWKPGTTWLYLSGAAAGQVTEVSSAGPLHTEIIDGDIGKASALKMCYAAFSKGTTALTCAILATADELGVRDELNGHWERDQAGLAEKREMATRGVTAKAWRFVAEMNEISETFDKAGLPGGFHAAAADLYTRLSHLKSGPHPSDLRVVLDALKSK